MSNDACEIQKPPGEREADAIQQFFRRPFFLSLTIGIPFCGFKLLFGLNAVREGADTGHYLTVFGIIIVVWAIADLFMNISRSLLDLLHRPAPFEYLHDCSGWSHCPYAHGFSCD